MKTKILLAALVLAFCSVGLVFAGSDALVAGQAQISSFDADNGHDYDLKIGDQSGQLPLIAAAASEDDDSYEDENDEGQSDDGDMEPGDDDMDYSDDDE